VTAATPSAPAPSARHWIVCADDFAIDDGAVDAILDLIERGRVTATSALVDAPPWRAAAAALLAASAASPAASPAASAAPSPAASPAAGTSANAGASGAAGAPAGPGPRPRRADVGLHLNLTQEFGPPGRTRGTGRWPLGELIVRCTLGAIAPDLLRATIERQLDAFEEAMGRRPDYIDGHQHVHQLATVREQLVAIVQRRYGADTPWLRSTRAPPGVRDIKARGIAALGDRPLRALAGAARLPVSAWLAGVYDFRAATGRDRERYRRHLRHWLRCGPDGTVLMCHPAGRAEPADPIAAARTMEYAVLGSEEFGAELAAAGIGLGTGSAWLAARAAAPQGRGAGAAAP